MPKTSADLKLRSLQEEQRTRSNYRGRDRVRATTRAVPLSTSFFLCPSMGTPICKVFLLTIFNWNLLNTSPHFHYRRAIFVLFLLPQWGSSFLKVQRKRANICRADSPRTTAATCRAGQRVCWAVLHRPSSLCLSFSVGKLLIKSKLDPLYVMAKLDSRAQL